MSQQHRLRRAAAGMAAAGAITACLIAQGSGAAHADAASLPPDLAKFANCPVANPDVTACFYIETSSATLDAGSFTGITSTDPLVLQFGTIADLDNGGTNAAVAPTNGTPVLQAPDLALPGGLLHMPWADGGALAAYITPEIIGLPTLNLNNLNTTTGAPLMNLDIKAHVHNPFTDALSRLGNGCYIGSNSSPISLNLTTGTTSPPGPNQPITGAPGTFNYNDIANGVLEIDGQTVVDNTWRLPHASGCGHVPLIGDTLDWVVDLDDGQAKAGPGHNSAVMNTTIYLTSADIVRTAEGLSTAGS